MRIPKDAANGKVVWDFSALLVGSGDARHMFISLIDIATQLKGQNVSGTESTASHLKGPSVHFTLVSVSEPGAT